MKKVIISLAILFLIFGSFSIFYISSIRNNKEEKIVFDIVNDKSEEDLFEKEDKEDEPITKIIENDNSSDKNISNNDVPFSKDNLESNNTTNTNVVKKEVNKSNIVEQEKSKDNGTTTKKSITTKMNETTTKETTSIKKTNLWDKYGVTEDEFYNKPAYKWEKVDFSIEKYGSESAATKACMEYGYQYEPYLNGKVNFNCDSVYSLSGRFLGIMFHTENLD